MRILALDTATETGAIALVENGLLLAQTQLRVEKTHSQYLWRAIRFLLSETGWRLEQVDLWAVSIGPGSFTGVRIGMATIKGLAWITGKPVVGVSTLEALAWGVAPTPYLICPVVDARRQEVYFSFYRHAPGGPLLSIRDPGHISPLDLIPEIREPAILLGNAVSRYAELFKEQLGDRALIPEAGGYPPSGLAMAAIARQRFRGGEERSPAEIGPLYLRSAEAEFRKTNSPGKKDAPEGRP
jgi:tRNA threonylcarbamoyladenosine biosynthesis protein TsaB